MARPRRWTDQQLAEAVAASTTLSEVCRRIGIRPGRYDLLRKHITRIGADASHLPNVTPRPARRQWTDDELRAAVADAVTISDVARALGHRPGGATHRLVVGHIQRLGLDTSHFLGRAWRTGQATSSSTDEPGPPSEDEPRARRYPCPWCKLPNVRPDRCAELIEQHCARGDHRRCRIGACVVRLIGMVAAQAGSLSERA